MTFEENGLLLSKHISNIVLLEKTCEFLFWLPGTTLLRIMAKMCFHTTKNERKGPLSKHVLFSNKCYFAYFEHFYLFTTMFISGRRFNIPKYACLYDIQPCFIFRPETTFIDNSADIQYVNTNKLHGIHEK